MSTVAQKFLTVHEVIDSAFITGALLAIGGTYWDIRYHIDVGRDSLWIPPHLMIYAGIGIGLLGAFLALWRAKKIQGASANRLYVALLLIAGSGILQIAGAPLDDLWHRWFGLDVTVWSPPHLLMLFAGFAVALSVIYFQKLYMHLVKTDRSRRLVRDEILLEVMFALALFGLNLLIAEFEYFRTISPDHSSQMRGEWLYLTLFAMEFGFIFTLAKMFSGNAWAATRISVMYFLVRVLVSGALAGSGSWPILPPIVLIPALFFDAITLRNHTNFRRLMLGVLVFACIFYISESWYLPITEGSRYSPEGILGIVVAAALGSALVAYGLGKAALWQVSKLRG